MNGTARPPTILGRTLAALLLAGVPAATLAGPSLSGSFSNPPYVFAARCDLTQPIVFVDLLVLNHGDAPTAAEPVTATDSINGLSGQGFLPPLRPGAQGALRLPLRPVSTDLGRVAGTHSIIISLRGLRMVPLAVAVPAAFCATAALGSVKPTSREPHAPAAANRPGSISQVGTSQSNAARIVATASTPAAPVNVHVSNGPQECAAHVGLLGALACPDMIRSGNVLLVWDWQPNAGPDEIDGFRVYRVDSGLKQRVYTRADKKYLTMFDMPGPSGNYLGKCYAVSAFAGAWESPLSSARCLNRQQTIVLASPSVVPTPKPTPVPRHVVIHVTEDSYPLDTVVAAGGDVTWINDDADEHSVYSSGGSIVGDLYPKGGRFTYTFRDLGYNYIVAYICEYHTTMRGRITVLSGR